MDRSSQVSGRYDVVIVGGRPAGASLAARLGAQGASVLLVDKARFPSAPAVPSCPVLFPHTLGLLDELGIDEADYAAGLPRLVGMQVNFADVHTARIRMHECKGRGYFYAIDRETLDGVLFQHLCRYESVTALDQTTMTDVVRGTGGEVVGVEIRGADGASRKVLGDFVVGADGRFSPFARRVGARVVEERSDCTSTCHFADWEGIGPPDEGWGAVHHVYVTGRGVDILYFPLAHGKTAICTHIRSDRAAVSGDGEAFYEHAIRSHPGSAARLGHAKRVSRVIGMKRVQNRYLSSHGKGWVLVGDAFHHKDPVDGQGIYDALLGAKILAEEIGEARAGRATRDEALDRYALRIRAETLPMFASTVDRLERELYRDVPTFFFRTFTRWLTADADVQRRFIDYVCRAIPPERWLPPVVAGRAVARGVARDLLGALRIVSPTARLPRP